MITKTKVVKQLNKELKMNKYFLTAVILFFITAALILSGCTPDGNDHSKGEIVYYCPMHPEVISDKPGVCPICHMDLVLRDQDGDDLAEHQEQGLNLSNSKIVMANVSTTPVIIGDITQSVSAYSYLDFAEQSRKYITARFNGRIEKLIVNRTGESVKKGDPLFEIYSPDLIQAQNEYLLSLGNKDTKGFLQGKENLKNMHEASIQKLRIMGITAAQLDELENSKEIKMTIIYYSPFSGIIIDKKIQEGMYINEGALIYEIADLSQLWNIAEVYVQDLESIKAGSSVKISLDAYPGEIFTGKVDLIYPVVNSQNRTVKVRSIINNIKRLLKPNMYGQAVFENKQGKGLLVPAEAIVFTGDRNIVWVETEKGKFQARSVKTGNKFKNNYEVLLGLKEGEQVAVSGGFLMDSESQLRGINAGTEEENKIYKMQPERKIDEPEHEDHSYLNEELNGSSEKIWNKVCPVIGGKVDPEVKTVVYKDKIIGFCCPGCDDDFLKDPEKYLNNLNENGTIYYSTN